MIQHYSKELKKKIKFDAKGELKEGKPVLVGFDSDGNCYEALAIEDENRTFVSVSNIREIE